MKLSEAIMLGRHLVIPVAGGGDESKGQGCALSMAVRATGRSQYWADAATIWPEIAEGLKVYRCPHCPAFCSGLQDLVIHLFDSHVMPEGLNKDKYPRITIEQLVDYIRQFEPAAEPETVETRVGDAETEKEVVHVR